VPDAGADGAVAYADVSDAIREASRRGLAGIQRDRIVFAMTQVAAHRGAASVTVANVVQRARISRRTFYEVFDDSEAGLLAAFDAALARAGAHVLPAYEASGPWRQRVRAALCALLAFLDDEPDIARLLFVEWLAAGEVALQRRGEVLREIVKVVDAEHKKANSRHSDSPMIAEGLVGGTLSILHAHIRERKPAPLLELANPLISMIVLPYLGSAAARAELRARVPAPARARHRAGEGGLSDAPATLADMPMRLTYRTIRVLRAVAAKPGASNRQVGVAADVMDQGQMSKLLRRLQHLGLIANESASVKGAPNQWRLTDAGGQLLRGIGSTPGLEL
jgi:AcrR family transcriptional regulator